MNAATPHIVAAPVDLVPDYIARLEADHEAHKRRVAEFGNHLARVIKELSREP